MEKNAMLLLQPKKWGFIDTNTQKIYIKNNGFYPIKEAL